MLQRAARNAYTWWWASHVRTKQSKWLEQNLQDMEEKVEYILKIIDEDGDTFRQRAEMYYRKRPEIVNFVEDAFRGYRALAERYDHLSRELQSANRAIATVYPERISFGMDENDDFELEKSSAMALPSDKLNMLSKLPPAPPKLDMPRIPNVSRKNSKAPTRLMSKKGLLKINGGEDDADPVPVPSSGLNKSEALERIDKLQKEILALQTEKEFHRSAYESGMERYWAIEKQITEMQGEVNDLQDEFGIGMVIGDDEARTLMTSSAIKSCQKTLTRLQQKQEQAAEDARAESQKVQEAREKFERLKEKLNYKQADQDEHLVKNELLSPNLDQKKLEKEEGLAEKSIHDLETLHRQIKEELQAGSGISLTISDLAEKVDEFVDKVISLENEVSSQNSYVKRLKSEANELQMHIQSLEEEKEILIDGSSSKSKKIRELEEELQRVQSLNQCIKKQHNHLQTQLLEASCNLDDLSEKLTNVKPDEEGENVISCSQNTDILGVGPMKQIQLQAVVNKSSVPEDFKDLSTSEVEQKADKLMKNTCNAGQTTSSYLQNHQLILSSDTNRELGVRAMDTMITPSCSLEHSLWDDRISEKDNDQSPFYSSLQNPPRATPEYSVSSEWERDVILSNHGNDLVYQLGKHPFEAGRSDASARRLKEQHNVTSPSDFFIERDMATEALKDDFSWSNRGNHNDIYSSKAQVDLLDVNPEKSDKRIDSIVPAKSTEMIFEENKGESPGVYTFISPIKGPGEAVRDGSEAKSDESRDSSAPAEHVEMKDDSKQSGILGHSTNKLSDENYSRCKENLSGQTVINKNVSTKEEKNEICTNLSPVKLNCSPGHSSLFTLPNDLPVTDQTRSTSVSNQQQEGFNHSESIADPGTVSRDVVMTGNLKQNSLSDQAKNREPKTQNLLLTEPSQGNTDEVGLEEDDQPNWRELFLNGLDDREKILLQEYTSILRNYKEARKKLNEVEKRKRASLFQYCIQIKVLRSANATKDAEIQLLQKKLRLFQGNQEEAVESKEGETMVTSSHVSDDQYLNRDQKGLQDLSGEETSESTEESTTVLERPNISLVEEDVKVIKVDESPKLSIIEEKIRTDIDELLEDNIEFWMRFSNTFHQVQKFQTTIRDLQEELAKLKEKNQKRGTTDHQSLSSDISPIYRHLTEIQTELSLWLEHNAVIKDDLENRLSSLSNIQEEITRFSSAGSKEEVTGIDDYQAAKFQGEVLNMKQENNKVAGELQLSLQRVKNLQVEIEKTLKELDDEFEVSIKRHQSRYTAVRSRIPLKSFLFGVKLKKQKRHSFLACISPSLQKQNSDIPDLPM